MSEQDDSAGPGAAGAQAEQPSPQGGAVGQPGGGQGDLSAEIERGERATANPDQDMGEDERPYYTR